MIVVGEDKWQDGGDCQQCMRNIAIGISVQYSFEFWFPFHEDLGL